MFTFLLGSATHVAVQSGRNAVCVVTQDNEAAEVISLLSSLQ